MQILDGKRNVERALKLKKQQQIKSSAKIVVKNRQLSHG